MVAERRVTYGFPPLTPVCKALVIVNASLWVLSVILLRTAEGTFRTVADFCFLTPEAVMENGYVWQLVTSMFLHDPWSPWHLVMNMLGLYFFGTAMERHLGASKFLRLYFVGGLAGSVCVVLLGLVGQGARPELYTSAVIGASGAVIGLLAVFATAYPTATILVGCLFPVSARVFALIYIGLELFMLAFGQGGNVAYSAHLGGALGGWLYYKMTTGQPPSGVIRFRRRKKRPSDDKVIDARFRDITRDL